MKLSVADGRHTIARWRPNGSSISGFILPIENAAICSRGYLPLPLFERSSAIMAGCSSKSGLMPVTLSENAQNRRVIFEAKESSDFFIELTKGGIKIFSTTGIVPPTSEVYYMLDMRFLSSKRIKQISDCATKDASHYRAFYISANKVGSTISKLVNFGILSPFENPSSIANRGKNLFAVLTTEKSFDTYLKLILAGGSNIVIHHPRQIVYKDRFSIEHVKDELHYDHPIMLKSSFEVNGHTVFVLSSYVSFGSNVYPYEASVFLDANGTKKVLPAFCERLATREQAEAKHWEFYDNIISVKFRFLAAIRRAISEI